ncbi:MAG: FimV/HubP family polar landmark protein [Halieaceae bacterium]|jgi:pilus assembly protein FimV|nr:FimV/HubP family polar landmark protein [Halieaceae bacterium]
MALGLGEINLDSYLNEPLKAQVDLLNIGGLHEDQIRIRLATSEDFKKMGVDRAYFLTSISFDVEIDDNGRARILISSEDPVLEPYLDFILEARWPSGRLLREYTVLVDPPVFDNTSPVVSASSRVAEVDGEPDPAKKNSSLASSSGTRVDIRDSGLAPGQMPSRAFNAATAPSPASGTRYMIHRDDTLWRIASNSRPPGASVHQTMLDIQRLNPDAFIDGNINKIKAGYIIYLPTQGEISSGDPSQALAEVRSQNQAWREGRASEPDYGSGPSLRISAEPDDAAAAGSPVAAEVTASATAMEDVEKAGLERVELEQRLASMEQQVETLQRIVTLKDDQIAALQSVLAGKGSESGDGLPDAEALELEALQGEVEDSAQSPGLDAPVTGSAADDRAAAGQGVVEEEAPVVEAEEVAVVEAPPAVKATPTPRPASPPGQPDQESPGFFSNLWFVLGAIVLALLGILFMRRRGKADEGIEEGIEAAPVQTRDVFADVKLGDQDLELEEAMADVQESAEELEPRRDDELLRRTSGYGERKHDEYASDEASDALAEAEIYIAYGRYPQAIELLRNALKSDPDNAAYRLKLLQLHMETGNRADAMQQLAELESIGDAQSIAAGREALGGGKKPAAREDFATEGSHTETGLLEENDASLESDFSDLEIEDVGPGVSLDDELDLSADFDDGQLTEEREEEDLLIAAESNGLATKLDLARAYMDMGDEDGARQILEEVAAEGNEEIRAEARALLERIG